MAIKWQQVLTYGGSGTISLFVLLMLITNLSGMTVSDDGDKVCINCYSEIKIFSTYWEIKVENAGDKPVIFKKRTRSRTLWINLDKIEEFITTDPQVKVEILVPTNRIARTKINHEDYGRLRDLKSGDTLIHRNKKSRPQPSRIILHAEKDVLDTVKWSFNLDHWLMQEIDIDPIWFGINVNKIEKCRIEQELIIKPIRAICFSNYTTLVDVTDLTNVTNSTNVTIKKVIENVTITKPYDCTVAQYTDIVNTSVCKTTSFTIDNKKIDFEKVGWMCKRTDFIITCDAPHQSNKDGICQSGERCVKFDIRNMGERIEIGYSPTKSIEEIKIERI